MNYVVESVLEYTPGWASGAHSLHIHTLTIHSLFHSPSITHSHYRAFATVVLNTTLNCIQQSAVLAGANSRITRLLSPVPVDGFIGICIHRVGAARASSELFLRYFCY